MKLKSSTRNAMPATKVNAKAGTIPQTNKARLSPASAAKIRAKANRILNG